MTTKAEFSDWKQHPVTITVVNQLKQRVFDLREILGENAGNNPSEDRMNVGAIKAYSDVINIEFEDEGEAS